MLDMKRTSSRSASLSWPTALRAPMPKCFQFECYLWEFITHVMVNLPGKLQMRDLISALCQLLFSSMLHSVHCPSIAFFEVPRKNTPQLRLMESCMCRTTSKNAAWPPDSLILSHYHWNRQTYRSVASEHSIPISVDKYQHQQMVWCWLLANRTVPLSLKGFGLSAPHRTAHVWDVQQQTLQFVHRRSSELRSLAS